MFEKEKKRALNTIKEFDRSNKGSIDTPIKNLIKIINDKKNFYTTSSCSGRIILIEIPSSGKKKDFNFLFRKHEFVDVEEAWNIIKNYNGKNDVWLRQEPIILHVAAKTLQDANYFLKKARPIGLKRSGLFEFKKRFLMEIVGTESLEVPIMKKGKLLPDKNLFKILVEEANCKLETNFEKTRKFEKILTILT